MILAIFRTEERGISIDYEYDNNKSWIELILGQRREVITKCSELYYFNIYVNIDSIQYL